MAMGQTTYHFSTDIEPDLESKGCTAGCHATQAPAMAAGATATNYTNVKALVSTANPSQSTLLTHLLPGGGHGGGPLFSGTTDPVYIKWSAWIQGGALQ
jgi:hypothetical protein